MAAAVGAARQAAPASLPPLPEGCTGETLRAPALDGCWHPPGCCLLPSAFHTTLPTAAPLSCSQLEDFFKKAVKEGLKGQELGDQVRTNRCEKCPPPADVGTGSPRGGAVPACAAAAECTKGRPPCLHVPGA